MTTNSSPQALKAPKRKSLVEAVEELTDKQIRAISLTTVTETTSADQLREEFKEGLQEILGNDPALTEKTYKVLSKEYSKMKNGTSSILTPQGVPKKAQPATKAPSSSSTTSKKVTKKAQAKNKSSRAVGKSKVEMQVASKESGRQKRGFSPKREIRYASLAEIPKEDERDTIHSKQESENRERAYVPLKEEQDTSCQRQQETEGQESVEEAKGRKMFDDKFLFRSNNVVEDDWLMKGLK